ncbi:MAG TPA: DUF4143 domain-containing protein [Terrimesophilobacter sp.]|nr:DUF4143 domain-containing protein [Terrimesophilobacter sp.]
MSLYWPRVADQLLKRDLEVFGAVSIDGPRSSGKTATASEIARSAVRLDTDLNARRLAEIEPDRLLSGARPRLLDEWQVYPHLWDHVRRAVDDAGGKPAQFILTGSAVPADNARVHSGTGRIARLRMRTMSLFELGHSTGEVSLGALFSGTQDPSGQSERTLQEFAEAITRGGWPALLDTPTPSAERFVRAYVDNSFHADIPDIEGSVRKPEAMSRYFLAYAQMTAQPAASTTIAARAFGNQGPESSVILQTAERYRDAAVRLMLIEDLPAWSPALRSRTRLARTAKRYFTDPSLAAALMEVNTAGLVNDLNTMGYLFENLVVRDLRVYAELLDAHVFHYRESSGDLEADVVVSKPTGEWVACEVKMGTRQLDAAAANLIKLRDTRVSDPPAALIILTMNGYCYQRPDGVWVVPLGLLGP